MNKVLIKEVEEPRPFAARSELPRSPRRHTPLPAAPLQLQLEPKDEVSLVAATNPQSRQHSPRQHSPNSPGRSTPFAQSLRVSEFLLSIGEGDADLTKAVVASFQEADKEAVSWVGELRSMQKEGSLRDFLNGLRQGMVPHPQSAPETKPALDLEQVSGPDMPTAWAAAATKIAAHHRGKQGRLRAGVLKAHRELEKATRIAAVTAAQEAVAKRSVTIVKTAFDEAAQAAAERDAAAKAKAEARAETKAKESEAAVKQAAEDEKLRVAAEEIADAKATARAQNVATQAQVRAETRAAQAEVDMKRAEAILAENDARYAALQDRKEARTAELEDGTAQLEERSHLRQSDASSPRVRTPTMSGRFEEAVTVAEAVSVDFLEVGTPPTREQSAAAKDILDGQSPRPKSQPTIFNRYTMNHPAGRYIVVPGEEPSPRSRERQQSQGEGPGSCSEFEPGRVDLLMGLQVASPVGSPQLRQQRDFKPPSSEPESLLMVASQLRVETEAVLKGLLTVYRQMVRDGVGEAEIGPLRSKIQQCSADLTMLCDCLTAASPRPAIATLSASVTAGYPGNSLLASMQAEPGKQEARAEAVPPPSLRLDSTAAYVAAADGNALLASMLAEQDE